MRSIAVINQKGGVGKTTTAVNLSAALANAGKTVCLIDVDPQAHASLHLGLSLDESSKSTYSILTDDIPVRDVRVQVTPNLAVVPSHIDLAAAEMELATEVGREIILRDKLEADDQNFDYCILDCPPSLGVLTLNALTAATEIFLPLQPHFLALHGLSKLLRTIDLVSKRLNPALALTGIVFCMYDSGTKLAAEVSNDVKDFFADQRTSNSAWKDAINFETLIRRNIRLAEAPSYGQSIFDYAPQSNGAADYTALATEVLKQELALQVTPRFAESA
ncbi:MAG: AAA family ATPase [Planctomycetota bacterium]|nr:AAA family ATPase [Planctomycetota bacterium]